MTDEPQKHRFLTTSQVAEELNVSPGQIRALLMTGELRALQVGGRGMGRRKEFFRVRPDEVLAALRKHDVELVDWVDEAEADEYRIGLTLGSEQRDEPNLV